MSHGVAAQLYTLREFTKTPADIGKTLARVRQIGYRAVQCSALGPVEPKELKRMLDDNGLVCCATHVGLDRLRDHPQAVLDDHQLWNCRYTAIGGFFPKAEDFNSAIWGKFIDDFNAVAGRYKSTQLRVGYHNHSHEFARTGDVTAWQQLMSGLDREIWIEIDTYWVQHGGADPSDWIARCSGRVPCVHLKDMGIKPDRTHYMMEVGQGNLNWTGILQACRKAGVEWYIVEQDTCYRDPFESLKISLDFLTAALSDK
jgi:sugar phosphate isomerase/epimerase